METYHKFPYKSNSNNFILIEKNGKKLRVMNSGMDISDLKISLNTSGNIDYPKYFSPPVNVERETALKVLEDYLFNSKLKNPESIFK
jgi:capsid portal protein